MQRYNLFANKDCFYFALETEVHYTISQASLFQPEDYVAIRASVAKDSTVLAYIMKTLDYRCEESSWMNWVSDNFNSFQIVSQVELKNNCTFCWVVRRQALDRGAMQLGVNKIVTGHNADDIAETFMIT